MKNCFGASKFIGFFDECGDHSMSQIDSDFPIFVLCLAVFERAHYAQAVIPSMARIKLRYWSHEGINLHNRDIRKASGPFGFLMDRTLREQFVQDVSTFMGEMRYTLFVTCINKGEHSKRYGDRAANPYEVALKLTMERVVHFLRGEGISELPLVAEARGKREDTQLELAFLDLFTSGTAYRSAEEFKRLQCPLVFREKRDNIAGLQVADLAAHPCARHVLKPDQPNRAYDIAASHIYRRENVCGWKVFP